MIPAPVSTPSPAQDRILVTLLLLPGVGRVTIRTVLAAAGRDPSPDDLTTAIAACAKRPPGTDAIRRSWDTAGGILDHLAQDGISLLRPGHEGWPAGCDDLRDPPLALFLRGEPAAMARCCAVVGTREPSAYGEASARKIAARCAEAGLATVSGLALGIDAAAHRGSLDAGGPTVAVLPWGVDRIVPASHARLTEEILGKGGALVSEWPPGYPGEPTPFSFIDRDRIQAALAGIGLIVVETSDTGGTMHAVRAAVAMGRRIAAVTIPGDPASAAGNRSLVAAGTATAIANRHDVMEWLAHPTTR